MYTTEWKKPIRKGYVPGFQLCDVPGKGKTLKTKGPGVGGEGEASGQSRADFRAVGVLRMGLWRGMQVLVHLCRPRERAPPRPDVVYTVGGQMRRGRFISCNKRTTLVAADVLGRGCRKSLYLLSSVWTLNCSKKIVLKKMVSSFK